MLLVFDLEVRYNDTRFTCLRVGTVDQSPLKRGVLIKIHAASCGEFDVRYQEPQPSLVGSTAVVPLVHASIDVEGWLSLWTFRKNLLQKCDDKGSCTPSHTRSEAGDLNALFDAPSADFFDPSWALVVAIALIAAEVCPDTKTCPRRVPKSPAAKNLRTIVRKFPFCAKLIGKP